ncbi:hypothetical protein E4U41_005412, partial [Claviceps citrina]
LDGLKRPPWRMVCSWALACASCGANAARSEEKSSGSSGLGAGAWLPDEDGDGDEDGDEDGDGVNGLELRDRGGELAAGAILRFLSVGDVVWNKAPR